MGGSFAFVWESTEFEGFLGAITVSLYFPNSKSSSISYQRIVIYSGTISEEKFEVDAFSSMYICH